MLEQVAHIMRVSERLIILVSGWLLTGALIISGLEQFTGVQLSSQPALLWAWAVALVVGMGAQYLSAWDKVWSAERNGERIAWGALGTCMALVDWQMAQSFALHSQDSFGISPQVWMSLRIALAVVLVALSTRERAQPSTEVSLPSPVVQISEEPAKVDPSPSEDEAKLLDLPSSQAAKVRCPTCRGYYADIAAHYERKPTHRSA
jgi:hypothetical protein